MKICKDYFAEMVLLFRNNAHVKTQNRVN